MTNPTLPRFALDALARVPWHTNEQARSVLAALPVEQAREILEALPEGAPALPLVAELVAASAKRDDAKLDALRELDAERVRAATFAARAARDELVNPSPRRRPR